MANANPAFDPSGPIAIVTDMLPRSQVATDVGNGGAPTLRGLHAALGSAFRKRGGVWLGWPGTGAEPSVVRGAPYRAEVVELDGLDTERWHCGFSAGSLWPLLHSMPGHLGFHRADWLAYDEVNARFAARAAGVLPDVETVWFHGHQLLRAPHHLREVCPGARIHFFLHTPFPPLDVFETLAHGEDLLHSLAACDLIGFQTGRHVRNFLDCAAAVGGIEALPEWRILLSEHGESRVGVFPMGIDWARYEDAAEAAPRVARSPERTIFAVDRLAPTTGVPERLRAFDLLLERHPRWREKVSLLQVVASAADACDDHAELKSEVDGLVGRVNGRFGTAGWLPVRYMTHDLPHEELCALYRDADIGLATPLRDGMNLVSKEFVACQVDEPGVLVLSRTAGAAETMHEAVLVNPYDTEATADALDAALSIEPDERRIRMSALRARERASDAAHWADHFLASAAGLPHHRIQ
ncbi:MAG: trehalose-6-phosphate synthase [bacterium]|nr:trehalose-6-phosphate synthase [bacterium]MCP5071238.1 trehalose-6-phosphate synthase [bacterium]